MANMTDWQKEMQIRMEKVRIELENALQNFTWSYLKVNLDNLGNYTEIRYLNHKGIRYPVISFWPGTDSFTYPEEFHRFVDTYHPYVCEGRFYILCDELVKLFDEIDFDYSNYCVLPFTEKQDILDTYSVWPIGLEMAARQNGETIIDFVPADLRSNCKFPLAITTWEAFYNELEGVLTEEYAYIESRTSMIDYLYGLPLVRNTMTEEAIKAAVELLKLDISYQYQGSECYEITSPSKIKDVRAINDHA
jgi:hypothetical protein